MPIIIGDSSETGDTSQVDICNLALTRLGANPIDSISEGSNNSNICLVFWSYILDEVSSDAQWNFIKKTVALDYASGFGVYSDDDTKTITGITTANPAVVSCTSHGFVDGNTVYIYDVAGMTEVNDAIYPVADVDGNSYQLVGFDSSKWSAYTSGGSCIRKESDPKYSLGYTYDLPADSLKALHLQDKTQFEILGNGSNRRLLTTKSGAILTYSMLEETTDSMLTRFVSCLAWRLAAELAVPLGKKGAKQDWAMGMYAYTIEKMSTTDARSDNKEPDDSDSWLEAGNFI